MYTHITLALETKKANTYYRSGCMSVCPSVVLSACLTAGTRPPDESLAHFGLWYDNNDTARHMARVFAIRPSLRRYYRPRYVRQNLPQCKPKS